MKKYISVCIAIGLVLAFGSIALAGVTPGSGIQGTKHDLSAANGLLTGSAETRICVFCHTPHFAAKASDLPASVNYYPLWNHNLSTVTSYLTYTNGVLADPVNPANPVNLNADLSAGPGGVSQLCLSCHDGSMAVNSYGYFENNPTKGANNILIQSIGGGAGAGFQIGAGGDLSNHHPVGFNYDAVAAVDTGIFPSDTIMNGSSGLPISAFLWNGNIECVSCHSVHNKGNDGYTFLWVDDTNSQLCLSCHDK